MNQTNEQKSTAFENERDVLLFEIAKDLASVEEDGFGRVVIEVKSGKIVTWWKVASRTRRGFLKKLKEDSGDPIA
jgi:hypothetical protein